MKEFDRLFLRFQRKINYIFKNDCLLSQALTHRSAKSPHNERLEFLGDAILNFVIAEELYQRFPNENEGKLSRMRAELVCGKTLAEMSREFELSDVLKLGAGELKTGGFRRETILSDAFEAIIGAMYLDSNMDQTKSCLLDWYSKKLDEVDPSKMQKDAKTRLQEYLQSRKKPLPNYIVLEIAGSTHDQTFKVQCLLDEKTEEFIGTGTSRRKAEQEAAEKTLKSLGIE